VNFLRRLSTIFMLLAFAALGAAAQDCRRHVEPAGPFSFCFPEGWTAEIRENQKFKFLFAPRSQTFTANINIKDEATTTILRAYAGNAIRLIVSSPTRVGVTWTKLVSWGDFVTDSQLKGERAAFETEYKGLLLRTVQYYFEDGPDRKIIVTGTCLLSEKDHYDPVFERVVKSFRLDR